MPSRQGRLDTTYFSQPQQSGSRTRSNGSQRQSQSQSQTQKAAMRARERSEEEDSEGSEGMNAIRLSESPKRLKAVESDGVIVDLISDDDDDEDESGKGNGEGSGNQVTEPKAVESSSRPSALNLVDVNEDLVEIDSPLTTLPTTSGSKQVIPLSATSTWQQSHLASAPIPKKRVDLTSGTLAFPLLPVPTNFTRVGPTPEAQTASTSRRSIPYIDLVKWTDEQKAEYTHPSDPALDTIEQPNNLVAFLGPDMTEIPSIPMSMPTVYEVSDSDEEDIVSIPPPKRRAVLAVVIPVRRSQSVQNGSKPESSRQERSGEGSEERHVNKKGKDKEVVDVDSDTEPEPPRPVKKLTKGKGRARSEDSEDDRPIRSSKKDKGKGRARIQEDDSDDESGSDQREHRSLKNGKKRCKHSDHDRTKKSKRKEREPSLTQREYLDELALDESTRFKTETRLRKKKETPQQRILRKLKDKRKGIVRPDTPSEDSEEDSEDDSSDSAADSRGLRRSASFIASDDGGDAQVVLPHEFSSNSAQTPEFKFKVVFQYFTLLAVCGSEILPLKGDQKEYFIPQLRDLRRKMEGHRDGRVRSQIWPPNYVKALLSYPEITVYSLNSPEEHCLACNRMNYKSSFRLEVRGTTYNPNTYEALPTAKQKHKAREAKRKAKKAKDKKRKERQRQRSETPSSKGSDSSSDEGTTSEEDDLITPKSEIFLGPHCKKRSILFHSMAHWEWILWNRIQNYYHDLLRVKNEEIDNDSDASPGESDSDISEGEKQNRRERRKIRRDQTKMRVNKLRGKALPKNPRDADAVQEWMDRQQYVLTEWKWLEDLEDQSKRLEFDRNKDE